MSDVNWPSPDQIAEMVLSAWRVINHWEADSEIEALRFALEHANIYLIENGDVR